MARGFQLHQYLCVATNWKKANQGFTWFYHCQVYGCDCLSWWSGTKMYKNNKKTCQPWVAVWVSHNIRHSHSVIGQCPKLQWYNYTFSNHLDLQNWMIWEKKQIRSVASIHPFQTNTNCLTRIYNRTIPYLGRIPTESRHHHCSWSEGSQRPWPREIRTPSSYLSEIAVNKWYIYYNKRFYYNILCNH